MDSPARRRPASRIAIALVGAALLAIGGTASVLAGNGLGAVIQIGFNNIAGTHATTLQSGAGTAAAVGKNVLQVYNNATSGISRSLYLVSRSAGGATFRSVNTGGGPAGDFGVTTSAGVPFTTNGRGRVTNLNADLLDGLDSSAFVRNSGLVAGVASATNSNVSKSSTATCPPDQVVLGGGGTVTPATSTVALGTSRPSSTRSWTVTAVEAPNETSKWSVTAYAICATAAP
jgi:hypothetical protein